MFGLFRNTLTFIAGVAVGVAVGVLLAPEEGKVTRERLKFKANEELENLKQKVNGAKKELEKVV